MSDKGCGCSSGGSRRKCGCGSDEMLSIPRGNDFRLHLCGLDVVPGAKDADFEDIEGLKAHVVSWLVRRDEVEMTTNGTDIIITVAAEIQRCTVYGIELTGTHDGHPWRWKAEKVFRIVDSNCEASEQPMETFGVETYYVRDVVWVEFEGETMTLYSDGHVHFEGDALILQDTDDTTFEIDGDTLYITTDK